MKDIIERRDFRNILYSYGLRNTPERYTVLEQMYKEDGVFSAYDIYNSLDESGSCISRATVYNLCILFCRLGLIEKVPTTDSVIIYRLQSDM